MAVPSAQTELGRHTRRGDWADVDSVAYDMDDSVDREQNALIEARNATLPEVTSDASLPTVWDLPDGNIDAQLEARMSERSRQTRQARSKFLETVH